MEEETRAPNFLPLDVAKKGKKRSKSQQIVASRFDADGKTKSAVLYLGRIPHGFYEDQMKEYFAQFGTIRRLRISRNKKTGKSKHFGFIEFESPEVAAIVADCMDNYLLGESLLQVKPVPAEKIHPRLFIGANRKFVVQPVRQMSRTLHNMEKDPAKQKKLTEKFLYKEKRRRYKIKSSGIDYDYPEMKPYVPSAPKKIRFTTEEEE